ncbi:hypothetical protein CMV_014631 [Castanea mollissima]|uniref:RNase H type-1 domain-containing protein n=1 Tax=Castanea mollissima TaxID=60419 RepID=A0A8J4RBB7_9ROSI|nr:hypothetical protein CMV_014631 [Castanea mollissima]
MVKAVVGEETQLKLIEVRLTQSRLPVQVGLVIGKLSSPLDRGFVFDLIPTPPNDAREPACSLVETTAKDDKKKGPKSKSQASADSSSSSSSSSLFIDNDWVAEHARQVARMLVGGMKVIGGGGLIRDCNGNWISSFVKAIGFTTSIAAKLWVVRDGLTRCCSLSLVVVEVETDATIAISLLSHTTNTNAKLSSLVDDCKT